MFHVRLLAGLMTAALLVATPGVGTAQTPIYMIDTLGGSNIIYRLDPASGQLTTAATLPLSFGDTFGLAALDDNTLIVSTSFSNILRVTLSPLSVTNLGTVPGRLVGLAAATTGEIYGIDENSDELSRLTLAPLSKTVIGTIRIGSPVGAIFDIAGGDLVQGGDGTWYVWSFTYQILYRLDVATAVATAVVPGSPTQGALSGLAVDYQSGQLYGSASLVDKVVPIDVLTGTWGAGVPFCVSCPTPFDHIGGDLASPLCTDADGDGYSPSLGGCGSIDCDDGAAAVHPGAAEVCNGIDDDCDLSADEDPQAAASCVTACTDTAQCVGGTCVTTPVSCDDGNPCSVDGCDPLLGCQYTDQPDGLSCSDGNVCSGEELCQSGVCTDGADLVCDDGNGCTVDSCSEPNGCRNAPLPGCCTSNADCADISACTINERCVAGECLSDPLDCGDDNACTSDACVPASGCSNVSLVNGAPCGVGDLCAGQPTCASGSCQPGTAVQCDDGNLCNGVESCLPQSGTCAAGAGPLPCTPGSKRATRTCAAEWHVRNPINPGGALSRDQLCPEGNAACDFDADANACGFKVALCFRVSDPRLPACTPADVQSYTLQRPRLSSEPAAAGALLAALDTLPGSTVGGRRGRDVTFSPALAQLQCTPEALLSVPAGGRLTLRGRTTSADGTRDNDASLRLRCVQE